LDQKISRPRARIAALSRSRTDDDPELVEARRDLKAAKLEDYIRRVVSEAPPLTDQQRELLAGLLRPVPQRQGAEAA
jgi:hypothetical protein